MRRVSTTEQRRLREIDQRYQHLMISLFHLQASLPSFVAFIFPKIASFAKRTTEKGSKYDRQYQHSTISLFHRRVGIASSVSFVVLLYPLTVPVPVPVPVAVQKRAKNTATSAASICQESDNEMAQAIQRITTLCVTKCDQVEQVLASLC